MYRVQVRQLRLAHVLMLYLCLAGAMAVWFYKSYNNNRLSVISKAQLNVHASEIRLFQSQYADTLRDAVYISSFNWESLLNDSGANAIAELEKVASTFIDSQRRYGQLSFVDNDGSERLQISQYRNGDIRIMPGSELTNLRANFEYRQLTKLKPGEAYASAIQSISPEHKLAPLGNAVVHVALPVYGAGAERIGSIIIVWVADQLLDRFEAEATLLPQFQQFLIDAQGNLLAERGSDRLARPDIAATQVTESFKTKHAEHWQHMLASPAGLFTTDSGHYIFSAISPLSIDDIDFERGSFSWQAGGAAAASSDMYAVTYIDKHELDKLGFLGQPIGLAIIAGFIVLVAFFGYMMIYHRRNTKQYADIILKASDELNDLYDNAPCGYHSFGPDFFITRMNATELEWLGYSKDEVVNTKTFPQLLAIASQKSFANYFEQVKTEGYINDIQLELRTKEGGRIPVIANAVAEYDAAGELTSVRCTVYDYTDRKQLEDQLIKTAITESLTGLLRRHHFTELAQREFIRSLRSGSNVVLLTIDIDYFKKVNDSYGHDAGDEVLRQFAAELKRLTRADDLVARMGGEEFAVLLSDTNIDAAEAIANRIRTEISVTPISLPDGEVLNITVSIGMTRVLPSDITWSSVIKRADIALYQSKAAGRNTVTVNINSAA